VQSRALFYTKVGAPAAPECRRAKVAEYGTGGQRWPATEKLSHHVARCVSEDTQEHVPRLRASRPGSRHTWHCIGLGWEPKHRSGAEPPAPHDRPSTPIQELVPCNTLKPRHKHAQLAVGGLVAPAWLGPGYSLRQCTPTGQGVCGPLVESRSGMAIKKKKPQNPRYKHTAWRAGTEARAPSEKGEEGITKNETNTAAQNSAIPDTHSNTTNTTETPIISIEKSMRGT